MYDRRTEIKIALSIFILILILRAPALWTPILDVDESQFAGFANALIGGGLPYIASVDTKPLGIYYFFVGIFKLFGTNNMFAVHLATAVVVAITALYCHRITAVLYSKRAGIFAALFYAVFTTTYTPKFISTSIVVVMMLPLTMSIYHLILWEDLGRYRNLFSSGILFGIACCFKYQAGITLILVFFWFLFFVPLYIKRAFSSEGIRPLLIFLAGGVLTGSLFALHLFTLGVWNDFWFWSVKGSFAYVEAGNSAFNLPTKILLRGGSFVVCSFLIWYLGIKHAKALTKTFFRTGRHTKRRCEEYLIMFWFVFSFIPILTGGRLYGHYFIQILPPLVILAASEADRFFARLPENSAGLGKRYAYGFFIAGLLVPAVAAFSLRFYTGKIYKFIGEEDPNSYKPIASYVNLHTGPSDKIFVWGFATPIYFFAERPAASRFLWCDWLTGRVAGSSGAKEAFFDTSRFATLGSWDLFFKDLDENRPVYFVDTASGNYHGYGKYTVDKYPKLQEYLRLHYQIEAQVAGARMYRRLD